MEGPMKARVLRNSEIENFVGQLLGGHDVFGIKREGDFCLYAAIADGAELDLKAGRPRKSAKEFLFPQTQTMFAFKAGGSKAMRPKIEKPRVLLGALACDLRGIAFQDAVFLQGEFKDPYYAELRDKTIIFGMACESMWATCFCASFEIDPHEAAGCDCHMAPIADGYLLEPLTEHAEHLIANFPEATDADFEQAKAAAKHFHETANPAVPVHELADRLKDIFEAPFWEDTVNGCLGCGACTFVCPTCHCFDIADETIGDDGQRIRTWDSCMAPKFTLHTSGHNPRTEYSQRRRQRMLHKFQYTNKNLGMLGCVGCGRCVEMCPVNWDIRDTAQRILDATAEAETEKAE
jgi:sulfhydrogenase subunit beta (sulfur reductase)